MHRRTFLSSTDSALALRTVPAAAPQRTRGPLRVHPSNPRYFSDRSGQPIYQAGSHTQESFQDTGLSPVQPFDWPGCLCMMNECNHNFMRFWHWMQAAWAPWTSDKVLFEPLPYLRTGPGTALDGAPEFDLTRFNPVRFERMRSRFIEAGDHGIYAAVRLFQSFSERRSGWPDDPWRAHPCNGANNTKDFDAEKAGTGQVDLHRTDVREVLPQTWPGYPTGFTWNAVAGLTRIAFRAPGRVGRAVNSAYSPGLTLGRTIV